MHALQLDFQNDRRKPGWLNVALLAGGLAAAAYLSVHSMHVFSEIGALEEKQSALEHQSHRHALNASLSAADAQQLRAEVKQANEVLARLSLPWENLFQDIESSQRNQVALLAIEPDVEKHVVRITGEAKDLNAMLGYLRFMQKKESLTDVYLQSHHIDEQSAEKPVRFVLVASWVIKS